MCLICLAWFFEGRVYVIIYLRYRAFFGGREALLVDSTDYIVDGLKGMLTPQRFEHSRGVEGEAVRLAELTVRTSKSAKSRDCFTTVQGICRTRTS